MSVAPRASTAGSYVSPAGAQAPAERDRLRAQAAAVWNREQDVLRALGLRPGLRLLDLGCGPGAVLRQIVGGDPPASALGLDRDAHHLVAARAVAPALRGDVGAVPLRGATFDFVLLRFVLRHLPDPSAALREAARVTVPGGRVCVVDADDGALVLDPEPDGWPALRAALDLTARRRGADPSIGRRLPALCRAAGLAAVRTTALAVTTGDLGARAFVELFLAPGARPIDPDVMPAAEVRQRWDAMRAWTARPDAFGLAVGIFCSGTRT